MLSSPSEHRHHLRSRQLGNLPAGRPAREEPAAASPHDAGAAVERRQSHPAVRFVSETSSTRRRAPCKRVCSGSAGRTHRSNQVTAPEYVFLISELAGEQRFASIVAKRLESLVGAAILVSVLKSWLLADAVVSIRGRSRMETGEPRRREISAGSTLTTR